MLATVHSSYYKRCPSGAGIIPDFLMNVPLTALSEDEQLFRDSCRSFAEGRIQPLVRKMDEEAKLEQSVIPELFDLGLMGIHIPDEFGGGAGSFFMSVLAVEEISRVDASFGVFIDVQNTLVNNAIMRWASHDQKGKYLPRLAKDLVGAYALSEAGSGSDAFALACRASDKGDHFVLNGRKLWIAQGSWEHGAAYSKERKAFGRALAEFQAVQFQLAETATQIEAARLMVYNAARLKDAGQDFLKEAAMAKYFSSQVAEHVTSLIVEIYGGYGYTKDYPAEKYFRDSKIGKIYEGTSNMQLQTIAKYLLR